MLERRIGDWWNIERNRDLSNSWTGFTRFTMLDEKPPDGYTWSRRRLTKKQTTSRSDHLGPKIWKSMSEAQRKEKQKWTIEKPKVDNGGRLFTSLIQRMRRSNKLFKKTRGESWKFRCHQQCLARSGKGTRQLIAILIFPKQNTQLKPTSLGESVYNEFHTKIMKAILQGGD